MNYYTERNFNKTDSNFFKTSTIFSNFLVDENYDNSMKFQHSKRKEILPEYSNIKSKINHQIKEVKSYFNIKNTIFKEIKSKDVILYNKFKKDVTLYFFGPKGRITQNNPKLKKYYKIKEKNKIGLNTKIYAGRWEYFENSYKYNRYIDRLKKTRKKMLKIGGNFSTEDDIEDRIHHIYLSKKNESKKKDDEDDLKIDKKILQKKLRRFSVISNLNSINLFQNNFFETSIDPNNKFRPNESYNMSTIRSTNKRGTSFDLLPRLLKKKASKKKVYNLSDLEKIKNIFKRKKILEKIKREKKEHYKKLNFAINLKLNLIIGNSKNLVYNMDTIKKNNQTSYTDRSNKVKFKEDIKLMSEDEKRNNYDYMIQFMKNNTKIQRKKDSKSVPYKIYFSYYDKSRNNIHKSVKEYVRNIWRIKEEERERKYFNNVRHKFEANRKLMMQLGMNLDNLINSKKKK